MKKNLFYFIIPAVLIFLWSCGAEKSTELKPGYDKAELTAILPVMERTYDSDDIGGFKTPEPEKIKRVFRSKLSPFLNRFDVWTTEDKKAIISIRGTIADTGGLSFTAVAYLPIVKAVGKIKMSEGKWFEYKLAELEGAGVHLGMLLSLGHISEELVEQIDKQYKEGIRDFIILGHSQGSAIAFLATSYIKYLQKDKKLPGDFRVKTYCIAAPKTGNIQYAYDYEKITMGGWAMSINNVIDWVPFIGLSLQSAEDFPKVNPFRDMRGFLTSLGYKPGEKFDENMKKLTEAVPKLTEEFAKIIKEDVYPRVMKAMPGYEEPEIIKSGYFERSGINIPMIPNAEYYKKFPNDPAKYQVWENHSVYPYYILVTTN